MERLRRNQKALVGALVVIGMLIGLVTLVVVPAVASTAASASTAAASPAYSTVPPSASPSGIVPIDMPTGGQSNDCTFFYTHNATFDTTTTKSQPASQFRIANPKKGQFSYTDAATGATFQVTVDSTDKWASFTATGAKVVDVGIKGGTDETWYNYDQAAPAFPNAPVGSPGGYVTADGGSVTSTPGSLHAPAQDTSTNPVTLYSISNLTFCYNTGSVSGVVYQDLNQDGANNGSDTPQPGWTVRLYGSGSTPLATTTSAGTTGAYRFNVGLNTNTSYRICEAPPSTTPGPWAQSQPYTSATVTPASCSGTGELGKGYSFTPTSAVQDVTGKDFGNVQAQTCPPNNLGITGSSLDTTYQIQLASCKPGQSYVFNTTEGIAADGDSGTPNPTVSVWPGNETLPGQVPLVEKIVLPFNTTSSTQPLPVLYYTDTFPFVLSNAVVMPYCLLDPRNGTEFGLQTQYSTLPFGTGVAPVIPTGATSCLIQATESAPPDPVNHPGVGRYTAYVYSSLDGLRYTP